MKFKYAILYVDDVAKSLTFYQRAFGFPVRFLHEDGDWGELETGETRLSFCSHRLMGGLKKKTSRANAASPCFEIAFTADDVPVALQRALDAGAKLVQAPEETPWGQTVAYVADPDDVLVEICTPVGD